MKLKALLASAAALLACGGAWATTLQNVTVGDITGEADVMTDGNTVRAYYMAYHDSKAPTETRIQGVQTINGVSFTNGYVSNAYGGFADWKNTDRNSDTNYVAVALRPTIGGGAENGDTYSKALTGKAIASSAGQTIGMTIKGLTATVHYKVQLWFQDSTATADSNTITLSESEDGSNGVTVYSNKADSEGVLTGIGQYVTFDFVATGATADKIYIIPKSGARIGVNMMQIRDITTDVTFDAENGTTWNTTGAGWVDKTETDILWTEEKGYLNNAIIPAGATVEVAADVYAQDLTITDATVTIAEGKSINLNRDYTINVTTNGVVVPAVTAAATSLTMTPRATGNNQVLNP